MHWLVKRLRLYNPVAIKLTGFFWLVVAGNTLQGWFSSDRIFTDVFGHERSVLLVFSALCFVRGAMGLFSPKLYWQTFRVGLFNITPHNDKRFLFLVMCACTWVALSVIKNISIPNWILLWGLGAWLLLISPYEMEKQGPNEYDDWCRINPATGLPMLNSMIDIAGNPYGSNRDCINPSSIDVAEIPYSPNIDRINPATGWPVLNNSSVDVVGNPYGCDLDRSIN